MQLNCQFDIIIAINLQKVKYHGFQFGSNNWDA